MRRLSALLSFGYLHRLVFPEVSSPVVVKNEAFMFRIAPGMALFLQPASYGYGQWLACPPHEVG